MSETIYTFRVMEGKTITVRKAPAVAADDYVGTLRSGEQFHGEIVINTERELWVKLTDKFPGFYAAVRYTSPGGSPKTFALTIGASTPDPETPPENSAGITLFGFSIDPEEKRLDLRSTLYLDLKDWVISVDGIIYREDISG